MTQAKDGRSLGFGRRTPHKLLMDPWGSVNETQAFTLLVYNLGVQRHLLNNDCLWGRLKNFAFITLFSSMTCLMTINH